MNETWRLLDTGLGSAARNVALNRALLEARAADETGSTLRFFRVSPAALLANQQSTAQELDLGECAAERLPLQRRITGGVTWLVDERQLGWELYLHRREVGSAEMSSVAKRILHAAATGLSALGIDARYRSRDEIEVDGRTLCSSGYAAEGPGLLLQALLPLDLDRDRMKRLLRLPRGRPAAGGKAPLDARYVSLREALGKAPDPQLLRRYLAESFESEFGIEFGEGDLSLTEHARFRKAEHEIAGGGWVEHVARAASEMRLVEATHAVRGGVLHAAIKYEASNQTIRRVWFSGDVRTNPRRALFDLEAALRDVPVEHLSRSVQSFFASHAVRLEGLDARDFVAAIRSALGESLAA